MLQLYHSTVGTVPLQGKTVRKRTLTFSQKLTFDKLMHCSTKHIDELSFTVTVLVL